MKTTRVILLGIILASIMVPLAYAINFIGAINYVGASGGNVTFAQNFQAYSLTWVTGLNYFTATVWGGNTLGNVGFDCIGCNMTVTGMNFYTLTYTVAAAGAGTQRIYYRGLGEPQSVVGGTSAFAGNILTVTTAGNAVVTVSWASIAPEGVNILNAIPAYLPLLVVMLIAFAAAIILMATRGELDTGTVVVFIVLSFGIILSAIIIFRLIEAIL